MGNIVGGLIGGVGSLLGGSSAKSNDLTGYNYLNNNVANQTVQANTPSAVTSENANLGSQTGVANNVNSLLTSDQTNSPAFQNYLNSTGYKFQLGQGTSAIDQNAASKGLVNSGATAKALTAYGQNLAGSTFNNYLGQLNTNAGQYGSAASGFGTQVGQGLTAGGQVGSAGTSGGTSAGSATGTGTQSFFNSLGTAASLIPF